MGYLLIILLLIAGFCLIASRAMHKQDERIKEQVMTWREQEWQSQAKQATALQNDIANWLTVLGLPQLVGETQRKEAARQLCTVLIERLVIQPYPDQTYMEDLQPTRVHEHWKTQSDSKASQPI